MNGEVDGTKSLDMHVRYTADETVQEFSRRHQTSVGNSAWKHVDHTAIYTVI